MNKDIKEFRELLRISIPVWDNIEVRLNMEKWLETKLKAQKQDLLKKIERMKWQIDGEGDWLLYFEDIKQLLQE